MSYQSKIFRHLCNVYAAVSGPLLALCVPAPSFILLARNLLTTGSPTASDEARNELADDADDDDINFPLVDNKRFCSMHQGSHFWD